MPVLSNVTMRPKIITRNDEEIDSVTFCMVVTVMRKNWLKFCQIYKTNLFYFFFTRCPCGHSSEQAGRS